MDILIYLHSLVLKLSLNLCDWWTRSLSSSSRSDFFCCPPPWWRFSLLLSNHTTSTTLTNTNRAQQQSFDQTATIDSMGPLLANHVDDSRRPLLGSPSSTLRYSPYSDFNWSFRCFSSCTFLNASLVEVVLCVVRTSPSCCLAPSRLQARWRLVPLAADVSRNSRPTTPGRKQDDSEFQSCWCSPPPHLLHGCPPLCSRHHGSLQHLIPSTALLPGHTHTLYISNGHLHGRPPLPPSTHLFIFNLSPLKFALMILASRLGGTKENQKKVRRHYHETRPLEGVSSPESRGSLCVCLHLFFLLEVSFQ